MNNKNQPGPPKTGKEYPILDETTGKPKEKVADYVATYTQPQAALVRPRQRSIAGVPASAEVWQFAMEKEIIPHLKTALQLVRESFHKAGKIRLTHDIDPEIEDEEWITVNIQVSGSMDELLREIIACRRAIIQTVPIDKLPLIRILPGAA